MGVHSVAVTGASGLVGRHLLPVLAEHPDVERVLGLDVREPERRPRAVEFARVDIAGTELKPLLEGIDVVVHLAGVVDPVPDVGLMARVNVEGTRHVLDAAASVGARRVVRISSATVYGAWPNNPVPLTEDAPLRPNPDFSPAVQGAEVERLLAEWRGSHPEVTVTTLRSAPVVGPAPNACPPASCSAGRRCGCGARWCPCRWSTSTTSPPRSRSWPRATCRACSTSRPTAGSTPPRRAS